MTTDTTDVAESSFKRETLDAKTPETQRESKGLEEDEGIQSSDEEVPTYEKKKKEHVATPKTKIENISSFKEEHGEPLFSDTKKKDRTENQYNFGDEDLEFFSQKL